MNVTVHISDELAARLKAAGANPERLALDALHRAADELEQRRQSAPGVPGSADAGRAAARTAAARIRQERVGTTLPEGVTIRDLVNHGRA